jgi:hypothetical protein
VRGSTGSVIEPGARTAPKTVTDPALERERGVFRLACAAPVRCRGASVAGREGDGALSLSGGWCGYGRCLLAVVAGGFVGRDS